MTGTNTATAGEALKGALYDAIKDMFAGDEHTRYVHVTYGAPGTLEPDDIVSILGISSVQENGPIGGRRSRDETLIITISISCWRGGGQEMERVTSERSFDLLRRIEEYCRVTDTTVGGTVWHCFLTGYDCEGFTDPQSIHEGRTTDITARFTAQARITN